MFLEEWLNRQTGARRDGRTPSSTTAISRILIANNGMAAVKCIRSIRRWAYEELANERSIQFTAMATPEDIRNNAEYVRMSDAYVEVPGGSSNNNYSNVDLIVEIAERTGVDAVYVGWGYASENPVLSEKLSSLASQPVFIGPPASAMRALGDKIASTIVAQSASVPCIDWSGAGLVCDTRDENGRVYVSDKVFAQATVPDVERGLQHADRIGYPVMIKASEGGGGKGIRLVSERSGFGPAYQQVTREIPGSPVFVMKVASNARHLEVQLLADQYGNAISIFGRDCSVQRRHQKIIEEAPVTVGSAKMRQDMEKAAVRLAKLVGYVSAGTVEYLYLPDSDTYYFLELNPRLQVEHPTTEMVSGVNIPAAQLQIAMGVPLHCIKDIRIMYGVAPNGTSTIDFDFSHPTSTDIQRVPSPKGHVIATRITAENPDAGFKPNSGMVQELNFRSSSSVWGYFSINARGGVHEYADSQFGHVFAYGETRDAARMNLIIALKELSFRGDFRTTTGYLVKLLEEEIFVQNRFSTGWLDKLISAQVQSDRPDPHLVAVCGMVFKAAKTWENNDKEALSAVEKGQTPRKSLLATSSTVDFIYDDVQYKCKVLFTGVESVLVIANGSSNLISFKRMIDGGLIILLGGKTHNVYGNQEGDRTILSIDGMTCTLERDLDPTKLCSPSPGKLIRFLVEHGAHVSAGESFAEIEVMKMYMPLLATESGVISLEKPAGAIVSAGDAIARLDLDNPLSVKKAEAFLSPFPDFGNPKIIGEKTHQKYRSVKSQVDNILDGFYYHGRISLIVRSLIEFLRDPTLPFLEMRDVLSSLSGRIPAKLNDKLLDILNEFNLAASPSRTPSRGSVPVLSRDFPVEDLRDCMEQFMSGYSDSERLELNAVLAPVMNVLGLFSSGMKAHETSVLIDCIERYHEIERLFSSNSFEEVLLGIRDGCKQAGDTPNFGKVITSARSFYNGENRVELILSILDQIRLTSTGAEMDISSYLPVVEKLTELNSASSAKVSLKAREFLLFFQMPDYKERKKNVFEILKSAVRGDIDIPTFAYDNVLKLVTANYSILDVLPGFFYDARRGISAISMYTYILHTSQAYTINSVRHIFNVDPTVFEWEFTLRSVYKASTESGLIKSVKREFGSYNQLSNLAKGFDNAPRRGLMSSFKSLDQLEAKFGEIIGIKSEKNEIDTSVLYMCVDGSAHQILCSDSKAQPFFYNLVQAHSGRLSKLGFKRVTFMILRDNHFPLYFTFQKSSGFEEDRVIRHIEPAMSYQLELQRLHEFDIEPIFIDNRRIHMYHCVGKSNPSGNRIIADVLDNLEVVFSKHSNSDCNHLFINFLPAFDLEPEDIDACLRELVDKHSNRLWKLRITQAERLDHARTIRFIISSSTGFTTVVDIYQEYRGSDGVNRLIGISDPVGPLHKKMVHQNYTTRESVQSRRYKAHLMGTTYVYDFPDLFRRALQKRWNSYCNESVNFTMPKADVLECTEYIVSEDGSTMSPISRDKGSNACGMIVWKMLMRTPEYPTGREIVVVANDVTYRMGSFGTIEDQVFSKATEHAREKGIPRIYISANSGARIGLCENTKSKFKIAFLDENQPQKGIDYLYLEKIDFDALEALERDIIKCEEIRNASGEDVYRIKAIIGKEHGIGVENLQGSGLIAGDTSKAYKDIFTVTLVTCRSVGIGAYLVRLGQRTVQVEYTPIILTGANALNKVLGRDVYTSNLQLGGTQIMYRNGISHLVAANDMEGVSKIINWLSFIPATVHATIPASLPITDPVDREVEYTLPSLGTAYDPRILLNGILDSKSGSWISGFFDKGSFTETLSGWAKGVVVGRARLGGLHMSFNASGMPIGCIAVETRATETITAADPADGSSTEVLSTEAGQVWYPNSAAKTAQAINDFNYGERLPLIIFANWRGFSGGQSDMNKEILKFGANIVEALANYKQTVFVYIVGELRGGAWVVLDTKINPDMIEMYAEPRSRGGVLEAEGMVEIKYRKPQILEKMAQLDLQYRNIKERLSSPELGVDEKESLRKEARKREEELYPAYHSAAVMFSDLHDVPERMLAKNVIRDIVSWKEARTYFYHRLLRRNREGRVIDEICKILEASDRMAGREILGKWLSTYSLDIAVSPDLLIADWLDKHRAEVSELMETLRADTLRARMAEMVQQNPSVALNGLLDGFGRLAPDERDALLRKIKK